MKELEIDQHNLFDNKQAFSNLVVPEKVMWVMCDRLAVAKDQMLVEDLRHMLPK